MNYVVGANPNDCNYGHNQIYGVIYTYLQAKL